MKMCERQKKKSRLDLGSILLDVHTARVGLSNVKTASSALGNRALARPEMKRCGAQRPLEVTHTAPTLSVYIII